MKKNRKFLISSIITGAALASAVTGSVLAIENTNKSKIKIISNINNNNQSVMRINNLSNSERATLSSNFYLNDDNAIPLTDGAISFDTSTSICPVPGGTIAVVNGKLTFINPDGSIKWRRADYDLGGHNAKVISTYYLKSKNAIAILAQNPASGKEGKGWLSLINIDNGNWIWQDSESNITIELTDNGGFDEAIIPIDDLSFIITPRKTFNQNSRNDYTYYVDCSGDNPKVYKMNVAEQSSSAKVLAAIAIREYNNDSNGRTAFVRFEQTNDNSLVVRKYYQDSSQNPNDKTIAFSFQNEYTLYQGSNNDQIVQNDQDLVFMNPRGGITTWKTESNTRYYAYNVPINFSTINNEQTTQGNVFRIFAGIWSEQGTIRNQSERQINFTSDTKVDMDVPFVVLEGEYLYGFARHALIDSSDFNNFIFRIKMFKYNGDKTTAPYNQDSFNSLATNIKNGDNADSRFRIWEGMTPNLGIPIPCYDNNDDYIYFFENNKSQMKVINPVADRNTNTYAYNTTLNNPIDLSNEPTINSIYANDPSAQTKIETILNNSLNSKAVNSTSFFNQYIIGSKVTLSNIVANTNDNSITAKITLDKAYSLGERTSVDWENIKISGFKDLIPTTLEGSASITNIDASLVNKTWKDVTDVETFKEKIISYFSDDVKKLFNIPLDANITINQVIDTKAPTGEVSFILNISKYIDNNKTEQSNGKFTFTISNFAKYNSKVKVKENQEFNYSNEVDITTITEEQIKAFILEKVKAGEIFEGQFINKNSVSDLTADDLVITLNKDMNADSGKGQYTVTVSLKKEAAYNEGQQATQDLTTPSFIIKGFKLVETTMPKNTFEYTDLFSGDIPNLEKFANGFDNTIKTMIVSKQKTLFENLPEGGIDVANINIVNSNIKDYATYASGKLLIQFTLNKVRPTTEPSKTFEITITGFEKIETIVNPPKSFPLGDSNKQANDQSIDKTWVKNKIIENKDTIFKNLPKKELPNGTTNWDLSNFLTISNLNSDPSKGQISFNVNVNNVYADGQLSEEVIFTGFKTDGLTTIVNNGVLKGFENILANEVVTNNLEQLKEAIINQGFIQHLAPGQQITKDNINISLSDFNNTTTPGWIKVDITILEGAQANGVAQQNYKLQAYFWGFKTQLPTAQSNVREKTDASFASEYATKESFTLDKAKEYIKQNLTTFVNQAPTDADVVLASSDLTYNANDGIINVNFKLNKFYDNKGALNNSESQAYKIKLIGFNTNVTTKITETTIDLKLNSILASDVKADQANIIQALLDANKIIALAPNQNLTTSDLSFSVVDNSINNEKGELKVNITIKNNKAWSNGEIKDSFDLGEVTITGFKLVTPTNLAPTSDSIKITLPSENSEDAAKQAVINVANKLNLPAEVTMDMLTSTKTNNGYTITFTPVKIYDEKGLEIPNTKTFTYEILFDPTQNVSATENNWWWIVSVLGSSIGALLLVMLISVIAKSLYLKNKEEK